LVAGLLKNTLNDWLRLRPQRGNVLPHAVFARDRKFYARFAIASHDRGIGIPMERMKMQAQQRELRKNYIGLISDKSDEQHAVESQSTRDRRVKDYLRTLVAVVRNRRDAR
jgi:hypothetical protein